ncbi:MAG: dienelactone hydrolase family protein [Bryobacteraceae bacterium]|nr:dienelactone hydrolase family protein [Bryobacteraceae bacterium]
MDSRRDFLMSSLPVGYALAVQPISAQAISTDTSGLVAGEVKLPSGGVEIPAYRAHPDKPGKFPLILVVEEIFGIHEHIKDMCRRFAKMGHYAIAPECFARYGDPSKISDIQALLRDVVSKTPDSTVLADLDAAAAYAVKSGKADDSKLAVTGWCWGGRITWLYAAHNPKVKAGGAWYGRLVGAKTELQPKYPVDIAGELKAPVLGLYGAKDRGIPVETVDQMRAALKAAGKPSEIIVYPEADHGFNADYRPTYNKAAAEDAMAKLGAWFKKHGAA